MRLEFGLLGPVEVRAGGRELTLDGPLQRRMLAVLLLEAGRSVSAQRLAELAWDGDPPLTARQQVQNRVSGLRRRLARAGAADVIGTTASGYRLTIGPDQLDVWVFDRLVARAAEGAAGGDVAGAVAVVREALGLWRGPALAGLGGDVLNREAAALTERRVAAWELCAGWELACDGHDRVMAELGVLVAEYPLRERLVGQYMVALYRAGRQADALGVYRDVAGRLAEDLGIDPGPDLRRVYGDILRNDPGLRAPSGGRPDMAPAASSAPARSTRPLVVPAQLPADVAGFVGRDEHLRVLDKVLGNPETSTATVTATIGGPAGVGKTMLAVHWAHRARAEFPDGQLHVNLRGFDPTGSAMSPAEALRGFLDAMEVPAQRIPAGLPAQIGLYRSLLADRRVLIVLDNARDAEQVRPLLPGSPGCRVVITSRNQLSGLVAADGAHPLTLDLLTTAEAGALLARRLGAERVAAEPDAVDEIIMRCARLPLALAIVAARAVLRAGLPLAALAGELRDTHGGLGAFHGDDPATNVRAVFSWSYHTLSTDAARLFRLLGLHPGPDIAVAAAASLAGVPLARARPLLAELTRAHLAAVHTAGRYTCHDLLRAYATEQAHTHDTDDERRTATHRLLDHYLHTTHTADRLVEPLGRQLTLAPYQPGVTAVDLADYEQAMAWLTSEHRVLLAAISQANGTFDGHTWQLAHCLRYFFVRRAMWQDMTTAQRHALAAAERLGDRLAQALIHDGMVQAHGMLGRQDDAYLHLRRALDLFEELGDHAGEGHMHLALAWMAGLRGRHAEALRHAQRSLDLYRAAKHRAWQARALSGVGWYHAELGDYPTAVARLQDALVLHQEVGDISGESDTWHSLGLAHHRLEQYERAAACYRRALDLTRQTLDRHDEATYLNDLGDTRLALGDHHAAVAAWQRALRIFEEIGNFDADDVRAKLADQTRAQTNVVRMDST